MSLLEIRVLTLCLLLLGTFTCGTLPILLVKWFKQTNTTQGLQVTGRSVISFLLCVGGGVLLETCFVHLLPEVRASFEQHWLRENSSSYHFPIPELIVCLGFLAVYILEEVLFAALGNSRPTENGLGRDSPHQGLLLTDRNRPDSGTDRSTLQTVGLSSYPTSPKFFFRGFIIILALSVHSVFEGFAVGLQDNVKETWMLFIAVAMHKFVISFIVGLELYSDGTHTITVLVYMAVFATMSPLGMLVAIVTESSLQRSPDLVVGTLNGLATGTLVYVTFFEILQREKNSPLRSLLQLLALLIGFIIMVVIQWVTS
ncbi:zinc transporter ZIP1-like [Limulus polyphemus]|uniref:Zinc transporter ZIP1-like n=1 Tax=Limulus polyphemus TaxID=6850 RepID=A0ABM1BJF0_LIMPO|nr:zinc transporter ZIP1-like [Limulus polyphemus]